MPKVSENTEITLDLKTIVIIVTFLGTIIGMWFTLQKDIEMAKELPEPNISRTEYDLKDQMVRDAIMRTQEQVEEIGKDVKVIDERLYEIQNR
jgi:PDZ domain-containing secreted protein